MRLLLTSAACLLSFSLHAAELSATAIMEKNFMVNKVSDSTTEATFTLINKTGEQRVRKTIGITKLQADGTDNMRMTRFTSPADIKGTVSLLIEHSDKDDDMWIYLPALKKVRRLVANNKKDSFVGTDFSYGDVIGHKVSDWQQKLIGEETVDGKLCYVIDGTPKNEEVKASSGYSRSKNWIDKSNFTTVKTELWDNTGRLLKIASFAQYQQVEPGRWQAMLMEAHNQQTGHRTVIRFENFKAKQNVKDEFFTTRYMEKE